MNSHADLKSGVGLQRKRDQSGTAHGSRWIAQKSQCNPITGGQRDQFTIEKRLLKIGKGLNNLLKLLDDLALVIHRKQRVRHNIHEKHMRHLGRVLYLDGFVLFFSAVGVHGKTPSES